jgi:hypothetical protein
MTTQEFIGELRRAQDKSLVFVNADGAAVHPGYHLTETNCKARDRHSAGASCCC